MCKPIIRLLKDTGRNLAGDGVELAVVVMLACGIALSATHLTNRGNFLLVHVARLGDSLLSFEITASLSREHKLIV